MRVCKQANPPQNPPISHRNLSMNRLLNRAQWGESNDLTPVGIELILVKMLMVEM